MKLILIILGLFALSSGVMAESVILRWDAPTTNTDLAGFKVYQGTATGVYDLNFDVGNTLCYVVGNLIAGNTYYFAATAYDTAANESDYSNEVSKLISVGDTGHCDSNTGFHIFWRQRQNKTTGGFDGGFQ